MPKINTPIKSIRLHCLECSGDSYTEVRECIIHECPLYPYRMGKRPTEVDIDKHLNSKKKKS